MNRSRKFKGTFETVLVIVLILIIPLFFVIRTMANSQDEPSPVILPTSSAVEAPESEPAATAKQPPQCTFPLAQTTMEEAKPEEYTFSEPKIVLTEPDNVYNVVEWLPDNQQVLITQDLNNIREKGKPRQQSIELYNPETGEIEVYAIRFYIDEPPSWQPELNAVVYPAMNFMGFDDNGNKLRFTRQVWVSYGNPDNAEMLADNLSQFSLAVKPGGSAMLYLSDKEISKWDGTLRSTPSVAFDPNQWDYASGRRSDIPVSYKMAWQPDTSLIFLYGDGIHRFDGYTYILDSNTGKVCELNLGGWAMKARWSLNGRYLAVIRTHDHFPIGSSDLTVLDTATGNLYAVNVTLQQGEGKHFVDDFAWAPDNQHILAIGDFWPYESQSSDKQSRLYLVDFMSGQSDDILPTHTFYASSLNGNLAWSPEGSKVLVRCPTSRDERLCFITVQRIEQ